MRSRNLIILPLSLFFIFSAPASTNYKLHDYGFGSGGSDNAASSNYKIEGITGEVSGDRASSTNNQGWFGFIFTQQANVPLAPTFQNTGNWYNKLAFIINPSDNPSDAKFAIAISTDDFVTTNYIQNDNTIGPTLGAEDYQTYANWGGASGEMVIGLQASTTYKIKAKAIHGQFTETGFGPTASATTSAPSISFSIGGIASGTSLEGIVTDVTTTTTQVNFGTLTRNLKTEAAQSVTVTTNAVAGYNATIKQTDALKNASNITFPAVSGTNAAPSSWPGSVLDGAYGYHTSDASLGTGTTTRFTADNTYAQLETNNPKEIAYNNVPVTNEVTQNVYAIEVGPAQMPGHYLHTITYLVTGVF